MQTSALKGKHPVIPSVLHITRTADRGMANAVLEQKASLTTTYKASLYFFIPTLTILPAKLW